MPSVCWMNGKMTMEQGGMIREGEGVGVGRHGGEGGIRGPRRCNNGDRAQ